MSDTLRDTVQVTLGLDVLREVAGVIGEAGDARTILDAFVTALVRATGATRCSLHLVGPGQREDAPAEPDATGSPDQGPPSGSALAALEPDLLGEGHTLRIPDVAADPRFTAEQRQRLEALEMRSVLGIPLRVGGRVLGFLALDEPGKQISFGDDAVCFAEIIAAGAALAIDRAQSLERAGHAASDLERLNQSLEQQVRQRTKQLRQVMEQHVADMRALVDAGIAITSETSLDKVLQRIVDVARDVVHARYAAIGVVSENQERLERFITAGMDAETQARIGNHPIGLGILGALLHEAKPLRLRDLTEDPRAAGFPPHHPPMHSFLGVPIIARGRVYGRLYLTEKQDAREFSEDDESLALSLAAQAAVAIENARLFEDLREQQERLVRAERLSTIGTLAATVGHELRNPLSVINNAVFVVSSRVPREDARVARNMEIIRREIQAATRIIEDMLDFSRVRQPQRVTVHLAMLVRETLSSVPLPANVRAENLVPDGLPRLHADPGQIQQVLRNLVENAVQAMPAGDTLRLEAEPMPEGRICLRVSDTGVGIAPEHLPHLFEPLFTTRGKGVGLGLALVKRLVEAHDGSTAVSSVVGQGTTFTLDLPAGE